MFRLAILADLVGQVIFVCLAIALYRLLSDVSKTWAGLMVAFVLVSAAVGFLNTLNNIAALTLFRGADFLTVFDKTQRDALGMLFVRLHSRGYLHQRDLLGSVALSLWASSLSLRFFAAVHRCLAHDQLFRLREL